MVEGEGWQGIINSTVASIIGGSILGGGMGAGAQPLRRIWPGTTRPRRSRDPDAYSDRALREDSSVPGREHPSDSDADMVRGGLEQGQRPGEFTGREIAQFLGYPDAPPNYQWARRANEGEIYVRKAPGADEAGYPKRTFNAENGRFETRAETTGDAPSGDVHRSGEWTTADKGLFGEMRAHEYMEARGYRLIGSHDAAVKQASARTPDSIDLGPGAPELKPQGIDGVYEHPTSEPRWVVIEAKFGDHPTYPMTEDGRQMSKTWVEARLEEAVGRRRADDMIIEGYHRWELNVDAQGKVTQTAIEWDYTARKLTENIRLGG